MPDAFNMTIMRPPALAYYDGSAGGAGYGNIVTDQPGERAVFTKGGGHMRVDAGRPITVNQIALLYTDLGPGERVEFIGSSVADFATNEPVGSVVMTNEVSNSNDPGYRHMYLNLLNNPKQYRYWQVGVYGMNAGLQRSAGRLALGQALQVEYNPDYGATSWGFDEAPEPDTLDSGVSILDELPAAPVFNFSITWATEAEMELWWNRAFGALQWQRRPVLVVRRPDAADNPYRHSGIFWGIMRLQPFVAAQFDMHEVQGKVKSLV